MQRITDEDTPSKSSVLITHSQIILHTVSDALALALSVNAIV